MEKFKRKVPAGIRPVPGHVPSTVFNKQSPKSGHVVENGVYHLEESRSQKRAQNELRNVEKRRDLEMLSSYNPWGKPGGGAPRNTGMQMMKLDKSLNESDKSLGSFADHLNKPGNGAPNRTVSGNPSGAIHVHSDIRTSADMMTELTRKRKSHPVQAPTQTHVDANGNWNIRDSTDAGDQRFHKSQVLEAKQKTDGGVQSRLKERLDQQITEKNVSRDNERDSAVHESQDWIGGFGKVGNVQRDSSGKIIRDEPLTQRGANGMREFFNQNGEKSIVEQFGKVGPGVAVRTESGHVHSLPRGKTLECEDPFRPGNYANQVFPAGIEEEANERALRKSSDSTLSVNKHMIENGYYDEGGNDEQSEDPRFNPDKPMGTVYSAVRPPYFNASQKMIVRNNGSYLGDLRKQIDEKQVVRQKQKEVSLDEDFKHIQYSDFFGRPGNGAPRLLGGSLNTNRSKLDELDQVGEGLRNPGTFRVT